MVYLVFGRVYIVNTWSLTEGRITRPMIIKVLALPRFLTNQYTVYRGGSYCLFPCMIYSEAIAQILWHR